MNTIRDSCKHVETLLPWFVNGSLEVPEHQAVAQHLTECENCRGEFEEVQQAWDVFEQHLPMETMAVLAQQENSSAMPGTELEREHLQACASCQEQVALMKASWVSVQAAPDLWETAKPEETKSSWQYWTGLSMAAALVMALGLGWFMANRSSQQDLLPGVDSFETQANLITKDLFPREYTRRSEDGAQVRLFDGFTGLALTLHTQLEASPLTIRIQNQRGEVLWQTDAAIRQENGTVSVVMPASLLAGDSLVVVLQHPDGAAQEHYDIQPEAR